MSIFSTIKASDSFRAFIVYGIAFAMAGLTPFVLLPILTKALSPHEFGLASSFLISSVMAANILGISAYGFLSVRYFKESREALSSQVMTSFVFFLINHLAAAGICIFLFDYIGYFTTLPLAIGSLVLVAAFWSCSNLVSLSLLQSANRPGLYLLLRSIQTAVEIGGCLLLLGFAPDATSRIYSYGAALAVSALAGIVILFRWGLLSSWPTLANARKLIGFGLPMLPHIAAGVLIMNIDRIFVVRFVGTEGLGIFMVAMQLGLALSLVTEPLNKAVAPWLFRRLSTKDQMDKYLIVKYTYYVFAALATLAIGVSILFWCFFDLLFEPVYAPARDISFLVAAGVALQGMYYCIVNYLFYAEATDQLSKVSLSVSIVGVVISYCLVSEYGLFGGAAAFALNNLLLFLAVWYTANQVVPMPWFSTSARER